MKIIGWIRKGDQAACGSAVTEGDPVFRSNGQAFAFKGAQMSCAQGCVISEGFPTSILSNSRIRVLHGMKTTGGCPLLSTLNDLDGISNASAAPFPIRFVKDDKGEWTGRTNEGYDQHFVLHDQQTGEPLSERFYRLSFNGRTIEGKTDANGRTAKVESDDPVDVTIEIMTEGYRGEAQ